MGVAGAGKTTDRAGIGGGARRRVHRRRRPASRSRMSARCRRECRSTTKTAGRGSNWWATPSRAGREVSWSRARRSRGDIATRCASTRPRSSSCTWRHRQPCSRRGLPRGPTTSCRRACSPHSSTRSSPRGGRGRGHHRGDGKRSTNSSRRSCARLLDEAREKRVKIMNERHTRHTRRDDSPIEPGAPGWHAPEDGRGRFRSKR